MLTPMSHSTSVQLTPIQGKRYELTLRRKSGKDASLHRTITIHEGKVRIDQPVELGLVKAGAVISGVELDFNRADATDIRVAMSLLGSILKELEGGKTSSLEEQAAQAVRELVEWPHRVPAGEVFAALFPPMSGVSVTKCSHGRPQNATEPTK